MNLLDIYAQKLSTNAIKANAEQQTVVVQLQALYEVISKQSATKKSTHGILCCAWRSVVRFCLQKFSRYGSRKAINGIYLWGGVGVGKTMLIDMFYNALPIKDKLRIHFHAFMQYVHTELNCLKGKKNPLKLLAKKLRPNAHLLCLDELIVNDIADAMLLAGLFRALYELGCCIVFTSNVPPDELYKHGLQRQFFLPAITLIKAHSNVLHLSSQYDYRQQTTVLEGCYFTPLDETSAQSMENSFIKYANNEPISHEPLLIHDRYIPVIDRTSRVVWFKFIDICGIPRSPNDFLALVKIFNTFLISDVPVIAASENNLIRSWINLIDVLYEHKVRLIISAAKPPVELYTAGRLLFEYARTQSRLIEMQSHQWCSPT